VLLNLLSNAVKFTGHGGIIDVSVGQEPHPLTLSPGAGEGERGAAALIVVRDSGVAHRGGGLAHIFEAFLPGDSASTRRYEGTESAWPW